MREYIIIEKEDDLSTYLRYRSELAGVVILTPSVAVAEDLKQAGIAHEIMGRGRECHENIRAMEREHNGSIISLRQDIADFLNEMRSYRFRGCHHPDCHLYTIKGLLFSIQYRYHLLWRHLGLNIDNADKNLRVYVWGDDREYDSVVSREIGHVINFSLFEREARSFSTVMKWSHGNEIKILPPYEDGDKIADSSSLKPGAGFRLRKLFFSAWYHLIDWKNEIKCDGRDVALCNLFYLRWSDLYHADGQQIYKIALNLEEESLLQFKRCNCRGEIVEIVDSVEKNVLEDHVGKGTFDIHGFHYYPFVRNMLREFIYEEVASLYWAEKRVKQLKKKINIASAHSDVPFYQSTYALFQILKQRYGVETFSYPHGAEGCYDYFWQERLTTSASSLRVVRTEEQRRHFVSQQERHYREKYHTAFGVKNLTYMDRRLRKVRAQARYDVICALESPTRNRMYTAINYPMDYDLFTNQVAIVNCLIDIASRGNKRICIKPKDRAYHEIERRVLNNKPQNVHFLTDVSFVDLLDAAKCIIIDCPSTVLFESMEKGKKVLCIDNSTDGVSDVLKRDMRERDVMYINNRDVDREYLYKTIEDFVRISCN